MQTKSHSNVRAWLLYPTMASTVTLILHFACGLAWGLSAFAAFVGWPLLGTLITADDDLPGGWSNPDGTERPPWRTATCWGQLSTGCAVSAFISGLDAGVRTGAGLKFATGGIVAGIIAVTLLRRQPR